MKRMIAVFSLTLAAGCWPSGRHPSSPDPLSVEWRQTTGRTLTADESQAVTLAKRHMADSIRDLQVAFAEDASADFSHVEFTVTSQTNGFRIAGRCIALYHSNGKLNGFPEGYFTVLVRPDGTVTDLHEGWE